ncbi:TIM barrel protein [Leucobacter sp. BZR 635]
MESRPLGVDHLTALELSPVEFLRAAAAAEFASVSLRTIHIAGGVPAWAAEPADTAATAAAARALGIGVHAIEAVALTPELSGNTATLVPQLEQGAALGAELLYCFADDTDGARCAGTFAELAALAAVYGLRTLIEPMPYRAIATLSEASAIANMPASSLAAGLVVDTLHASRGGTHPADLTALPQGQLALLQLSDAPAAAPRGPAPSGLHPLMHEARFDRLDPGSGELPLAAYVAAMPASARITVEAPSRTQGIDQVTRLRALRASTLAALTAEVLQ